MNIMITIDKLFYIKPEINFLEAYRRKRNIMAFSSLRLDIPENGGHFERTIPLPLRSLVSNTMYQSFASEIDTLIVSNQNKQTVPLLFMAGCLVGFVLFGVGGFLSVQQFHFNPLIIVGFIIFIGSPLVGLVMSSSVHRQFADKIKQVCEDYSRKFGTITVHYKEEVSY